SWYSASAFYAERFAVQEARLQGYKERLESQPTAQAVGGKNDLIVSWAGGARNACMVSVNGEKLTSFARDYKAVLLCGLRIPARDRFTDSAITVSRSFGIEPSFAIEVQLSPQMNTAIVEASRGVQRPAVPP